MGAVITLSLNFWWIPLGPGHLLHGYVGSAWATFICYGSMMVVAYLLGQKYYPVPYRIWKAAGYAGLALLLYLISVYTNIPHPASRILLHTGLLSVFLLTAFFLEKPGGVKVSD